MSIFKICVQISFLWVLSCKQMRNCHIYTRLYPPIYIGGKADQQIRDQQKRRFAGKCPVWSLFVPGDLQTGDSSLFGHDDLSER